MSFYTFMPKLFNMSLTASVAIVLVILLRLLLKKAPKVISYALWGVVLFRLLCPVSIGSGFSLYNLVDAPTEESGTVTSVIEYVPSNIVHTEYPSVALPVPGISDAINEALPQGEEQLRADPLEGPVFIVTYVWMAGVLAMVIYSIVSYIRLRSKLSVVVPLRDNIFIADDIKSPFVVGLFRPKIYLPCNLGDKEQEYIILHEQHHIKRLDHVMKALAFLALAIHCFNPLVWVAFVLASKDMEMSCDEAVIRKIGGDVRADYSASLLTLATGRRIIAGMPLAFGEGNTKGRIKNLANWKKPAFWVVLVAVIACITLAIGLLTNPKQDSFKLRIVVPAGSQEEFVYSDEEISTIGNSIKIWSGDELGDTEVLLSPVDKTTETGYTATYLTHGMPAVFDAEKDTWFRVGVNMQNPTNGDVIVYVEVENVEVRILDKDTTITEIIPGTTYVSWQCLYMNPLSSYAAMGGDSGCKYVVGDDYFATYRRNDGSIISVTTQPNLDTASSGLQSRVDIPNWKWQAFPYTDEEWDALYKPSISDDFRISEIYDEILYQPLLDGEFLLRVDGDLWLVELRNNPQMGTYLWSIYSLVPESAMGVAQWEYVRSNQAVFPFTFEMDCDEVSAVCADGGQLIDPTSGMVQEGENTIFWYPRGEDGRVSSTGIIRFTVHKEGIMTYAGTIYIESTGGDNHGYPIYTASLVGTGLHLSPNTESEGGVISAVNASVASPTLVTEHDLRTGGLEVHVEDLDQYVFFTNSEKIAVEVQSASDFEGEIVLHDISQSGEGILFAKVGTKDNDALFSNLTSARMYRLSCEGLDGCTLVITEK